ncbi:uncharacterized protein VK521_006248 isoform 1-T1 [Ammospiza maritima maritima]
MKRAEGNMTNIICVSSPEVDETCDQVAKTTRLGRSLWNKDTGPAHSVDMTQSPAQCGIPSTLKESHIRKKSGKLPAPCRKLKHDQQRRVLVSRFEDAVKSMEFCCSGCFSEHSTLSALTPKIAT